MGPLSADESQPAQAESAPFRYTHIVFDVAPITPDWVYSAGVPEVIVPERGTPARKVQKPTYS
ncbi:MAG: hypothetical protein CK548_03210 [Opitutia bacterium]|nr:hypothetical protein [Opitutaceae bacterium]PHX72778.1 MAG: hypothetical protein CK548_03210 [Opitutae bacterium]